MDSTTIIIIAAALLIIIVIAMYNTLVRKKNNVANAEAGIDVQLKKPYDLIPNLIDSVKQYMKHEEGLLNKITELRTAAVATSDTNKKVELDNELTKSIGNLMVSVENYPDLKASENFLNLQRNLTEVESQISAARRSFNAAVTDFNNAVETFPSNLMANMMNYRTKPLFDIPDYQKEAPSVAAQFK